MKSYARDLEPIKLLKQAMDIFSDGEVFHTDMSLNCQSFGLNGHKRYNRVQASDDRNHRIKVSHYILDMFGEKVEPKFEYNMPMVVDIKDYLEKYLEWEISVYQRIAKITNELMVKEYYCESKLVSDCLSGVRKEIEKVRRWIQMYELTGYDMSYILLTDRALHEKVKEVEED